MGVGSSDRNARVLLGGARERTCARARARRSAPVARLYRFAASLLAVGAIQCANVTTAPAESSPAEKARGDVADGRSAGADLAHASDFRVRVSAALLIGRTHPDGARVMLEHALGDTHPAVRAAAAAALIAVGDPSAVTALEHAMREESSGSARAQMQSSINTLRGGQHAAPAVASGARYVVQLGSMKNGPNVRGGDLGSVLRAHARAHASTLPGAFVLDAADPQAPSAPGHMPVLLFDGTVTRLAQSAGTTSTRIEAQVEFAVRRIPQQTLQGTLSGTATAIESTRGGGINASRLADLQNQAIGSAVESALRGVDRVALAAK